MGVTFLLCDVVDNFTRRDKVMPHGDSVPNGGKYSQAFVEIPGNGQNKRDRDRDQKFHVVSMVRIKRERFGGGGSRIRIF